MVRTVRRRGVTAAKGWTRHYYDAVEYYYWGPDKLECKRVSQPVLAGAEAVIGRLRRLEEPLNHILSLFFDLAPPALVKRLLADVSGIDVAADVRLSDRGVHAAFPGLNVVQPDFLFECSNAIVSVELKLGAKSGFDQVLKYAVLHQALRQEGRDQSTALIYLTEKPFDRCWPSILTPEQVLSGCLERLATAPALGQLVLTDALRQSVGDELGQMRLAAMGLSDLKAVISEWRVDADITLGRLCDGVIGELEARGI